MGFSFISRKGVAGVYSSLISRIGDAVGCSSCSSGRSAAGVCSSLISGKVAAAAVSPPNNLGGCGARGVSTAVDGVSGEQSVINCGPKTSSPWLMLPPELDNGGNKMIYKFYSLAENKVHSLNKKKIGGGEDVDSMVREVEANVIGSSHGWLALFNKSNGDLFLYNPISGRYIKLPPIENLPFPEHKVSDRLRVRKLILSCSPDDDENCRAMINYGPPDRLAFCCPGRGTEWTPLGTRSNYRDFVYSSRKKLFFCAPRCGERFEAWDLREPQSPRLIPMVVWDDEENYPLSHRSSEVMAAISDDLNSSSSMKFLVVAEHSDELFLVMRNILQRVGPDGSYVESTKLDMSLPYKTICFDVYKVGFDSEQGTFLKYMDNGSLDGLAFFIGFNHGFALRASEFPNELIKPNSIYFTDADAYLSLYDHYGGHDLGIFNYENMTISSCYYPCDVQSIKRIEPAPMWFTPSQPYETSV